MSPRRDLVVVGAAEGDLAALSTILKALPVTFQAPILVAQRTHAQSVQTLVRIMDSCASMPVSYACEGRFGRAGHAYLPPAGLALVIRPEGVMGVDDPEATSTGDGPVDRLFSSAAAVCGQRVIGVLLSGCAGEGRLGMSAIEEAAGVAVVQAPDEADVAAPPRHAPHHHPLPYVAPLDAIAPLLAALVEG
ncbi:chemotaxis protein CheB [Variovorax sp. J22R24]|uniref:chemotaxis protein CheB n=1 Tax=Variovorax gracilis TaxID=3053502 RepID=UPI00257865F5|nr:chemotaxis protein CheB [Variovorax sp. J22R24]MDM0109221.1 chemotaxis protein CheB [Variovorax sp. J22R24]